MSRPWNPLEVWRFSFECHVGLIEFPFRCFRYAHRLSLVGATHVAVWLALRLHAFGHLFEVVPLAAVAGEVVD